jgi:hypothetical protein
LRSTWSFVLLLLAPACADETPPEGGEPPASALDRLVAAPRQVDLAPDQAAISVDVLIRGADGWQVYQAAPALARGGLTMTASPDGNLQLAAAELAFEDILVGDKGVPPTGLHLTGVRVSTRVTHECDWVEWAPDGDACAASIPAVFYLDWSMVATDGEVHPLGTQELAPMDLWVDLGRDSLGLTAGLSALEPGPLWSWAGVVEFRDLQIEASGHEIVPLIDQGQ